MILLKFDRLRRQKEYKENRKLPLRTLAKETGLSLTTIQRLNKGGEELERVYLSTLDKLCLYFNLKDINELIEFTPEKQDDQLALQPS